MSIEQEPEAWILEDKKTGYRRQCAYKPTVLFKEAYKVIPLYTAPPKREPLSDDVIWDGIPSQGVPDWKAMSFIKGIKFAEKMHRIGGGGC